MLVLVYLGQEMHGLLRNHFIQNGQDDLGLLENPGPNGLHLFRMLNVKKTDLKRELILAAHVHDLLLISQLVTFRVLVERQEAREGALDEAFGAVLLDPFVQFASGFFEVQEALVLPCVVFTHLFHVVLVLVVLLVMVQIAKASHSVLYVVMKILLGKVVSVDILH